MKKFLIKGVILMTICAGFISSCSKEESDPRDQFVGSYTYTGSLSMTLSVLGVDTSVTQPSSGILIITKAKADDKINVTDNSGTMEFTVNGSSVSASVPFVQSISNGTLNGTAIIAGNISGSVLTLTYNVTGSAIYFEQGVTIPGTFKANGTQIATKQ